VLCGLGLISAIDPIGCLLKEKTHHFCGGFENSHTYQQFPLLDSGAVDRLAAQAADQLLEFGLLA